MTGAAGEVVVVATGVANTASWSAALVRVGARAVVTTDGALIERAAAVVLPGVGSFGVGLAALGASGAAGAVRERVIAGRATLAVCLGMQMLFESSDEAPGVAGLGVCAGRVERFPSGVSTPHLGWNRVRAGAGVSLLGSGWAYFANSHRVTAPPTGWAVALAEHGGAFVAAMERGTALACQCHPELSGAWGRSLIERWLARAGVVEVAPC